MSLTVPPIAELQAPASWRTVDFISDLHLQPSEPATVEAWQRYLDTTPADAVFMLGDLFEVWVGDDAALSPGFETACADAMRQAAQRLELFFMHGNRDFLLGTDFLARCGARLLADPTALAFAGQRWLLSHGDALCLDDTDYMAFRAQVRSPAWQQAFLARPLAERQAVARSIRAQSEARKRSGAVYADLDGPAARAWLQAAQAATLIHGHTHRPADHDLGAALRRVVLSDWDAAAEPPRAQALRLTAAGLQRLEVR
ncbi:UDP-2,3-diacylglucosamine diphosphatase [Variovorax terrae]|uniref:UDP-2,3-diacylglucosamine hydrolase n=1 Tax=Variovorax terrae TaxID=2923278 RepID=A0A9X2ANW6_9BURK|nr:UDP-2,3-diacylglucosamine diphosphatase [Variovorax terrae]MCJ0762817.1 UDP-2,3-diacylglucosamine diphosphatase [Variovorax terrae]